MLLPHKLSQLGPALSKGDVNGDGLEDLFVGGASGQNASIYIQLEDKTFFETQNEIFQRHRSLEDVDAVFFDSDNDGDQDLYVVTGGNEFAPKSSAYLDRLYINDGNGNFKFERSFLPEIYESGSTVKPFDFDNDGDIDIYACNILLVNDGLGFFTYEANLDRNLQFQYGNPMSSLMVDINNDEYDDLIFWNFDNRWNFENNPHEGYIVLSNGTSNINEWELKGVPLRIEIGPKDIENNSVVFSRRDGVNGKSSISIDDVSQKLKENLDDIQSNLLETSKNFRKENTIHVDSKAELIDTLNSTPGFVTCYWDENTSDEIEIKDLTKATLRCYLLDNEDSAKSVNNVSVEGKKAIFSKAY